MTKILNLDEIASAEKALSLKGETHEMKPLSVGEFVKNMKAAEEVAKRAEAGEEIGLIEEFEMMLGMVKSAFPTMPEEHLRELSLEQLNAIFEFVKEVSEPNEEEAAAGDEGKGKKAK